ncbi:type II toxin-antitoxin system VapB family antitoxin [uncultured Frigoribacterium sp.]|uniref:type II toxin-antitoxin system VapB family antitoxin n=1 Tax=uncultured Frigoribacterium sp. TaxID=335377 RepID=UPI0028D83FE7|nr:type II toxin-antitoxin system VapB family antitoxin [uncultured Frigoribacterium sp.]
MTSVDVDTELLTAAKSILGVRTTKDAINQALGDIVKRQRQLDALATLSVIEVDVDPRAEELRDGDA